VSCGIFPAAAADCARPSPLPGEIEHFVTARALRFRGVESIVVHESTDQADVIQLLSDPATHGGSTVERIDTHSSIVFLVGTRALKLKRAVKYDYLDFSTPALRRHFCDAEMRINSRLAPALYRRVLPVTRAENGALVLGGDGPPVDWVIEMTRFEQGALLSQMAAEGRLDLALMGRLAEEIASCHESSAVRADRGGEAGIRRVVDGNATGLRQFGHDSLDPAVCDSLTGAARRALRDAAPLLESRRREDFVRECHGDLHLGNIVLWEGRPTLFDAIEFNDDISCIDVMYDLAFLLMDLWHRSLPAHANAVLNAYLRETHDLEGLGVLPLFLSCRAAIRAKTTATAATMQAAVHKRRVLQAAAREYLELAQRFLRRTEPVVVAIGGLSGSGKSTVARVLAPLVGMAPGAIVLRSDEIRKRLWGASPLTKLDAAAYTPEMSARVYEALAGDIASIAGTGHSVIADAVFARAADRAAIERAARAAGVAFAAVWLEAPEDVLIDRVVHRAADVSDADADVVRMQCAQSAGDLRWPRVDAAADLDHVCARVHVSLQQQAVALNAAA
jgi:aminoglycoside phosphotransferase family enzyme/predicted kinase